VKLAAALLLLLPGCASATPAEALRVKYERMKPFMRNAVEREVLDVSYRALEEGRRDGRWMRVNLEDLMAHARQESGGVLDALAEGRDISSFRSVGHTVWGFHQLPSNDLLGFISFSVWQTITPNYLWFGKDISPKLAALYARAGSESTQGSCSPIPNGFPRKGFDGMNDELAAAVEAEPALHAKVIAALVDENYRERGVRSPAAVRAYFWSAIQKDLEPSMWLNPVRYPDDIAPMPSNHCADNNAKKRGDYGKQVMLGNTYNDRGALYWYAVTRDETEIEQIVRTWSQDRARITKRDYVLLRERGHLRYAEKNPEIYEYVLSHLPAQ
jgi:hypothetical protein